MTVAGCYLRNQVHWVFSETTTIVPGPVCISFSLMGKKEGVSSPAFKTHDKFYRQAPLMADVLILENVTEYSPELVQSQLGKSWTLQHCKIDPRLFGLPAARARIYLIAYKHDIVSWRQEVSLELVLGALASRVVRDAGMYTWMSLPPMTLSAAQEAQHIFICNHAIYPGVLDYRWLLPPQERNLKEYDQDVRLEGKRFPDLNQLARNGRGRAECSDGSLQTLTCNSASIFDKEPQGPKGHPTCLLI